MASKPFRCYIGLHDTFSQVIYDSGFRMPFDAYMNKKEREFWRHGKDWLPELYFYKVTRCIKCSFRAEKMLPYGEEIHFHKNESRYPNALERSHETIAPPPGDNDKEK